MFEIEWMTMTTQKKINKRKFKTKNRKKIKILNGKIHQSPMKTSIEVYYMIIIKSSKLFPQLQHFPGCSMNVFATCV